MSVIEILNGPERRRRWSVEEKLAILSEAAQPGFTVSGTARRHGVHPNQVFRWRRLAREGRLGGEVAGFCGFAPVSVVGDDSAPGAVSGKVSGKVEVLLGNGRVVRVEAGIEPDHLSRLVSVLER